MRNPLQKALVFTLACVGLVAGTFANSAWARNPWASAIGEACAVQHRAEDIANRIKRTAPHSHLVRHAMALDHLACALVDRVKCGAPCNQVQGLYDQLQGAWNQLRVAIYTDSCLCGDRTLKSLADGMDTRMRNLCRAIERVVEREFRCPPNISYNSIPLGVPSYSYRVSPQPTFGFQNPSFYGPSPYGPEWAQPAWPNPDFGPIGPRRAY